MTRLRRQAMTCGADLRAILGGGHIPDLEAWMLTPCSRDQPTRAGTGWDGCLWVGSQDPGGGLISGHVSAQWNGAQMTHNPEVEGSNPSPATKLDQHVRRFPSLQRDSRTGCCQSFVSGGPGLRSGPFGSSGGPVARAGTCPGPGAGPAGWAAEAPWAGRPAVTPPNTNSGRVHRPGRQPGRMTGGPSPPPSLTRRRPRRGLDHVPGACVVDRITGQPSQAENRRFCESSLSGLGDRARLRRLASRHDSQRFRHPDGLPWLRAVCRRCRRRFWPAACWPG
jgi:hypothetical protein